MKKIIARGMASFLIMVIIVLTMFTTICYATGNDNNYNIDVDVNVEGSTVKVIFDEETKILTIKNQTSKNISWLKVTISVEEEPLKTQKYALSGLETLEIDVAQYLSEDLIEEKNIDFRVEGSTKWPWYFQLLAVLGFFVIGFAIVVLCRIFFRSR